jgi:hypothetical protein
MFVVIDLNRYMIQGYTYFTLLYFITIVSKLRS